MTIVAINPIELKGKVKQIIEIDYKDFEKFATACYKFKNYSFVATEESSNGSLHEFQPGEDDELDEDDAAKIRAGKVPDYGNGQIFECLVADGYLPKGNTYIVNVFW